MTGLNLAATPYASESAVATAVAGLSKPAYLNATTALVSGTIKTMLSAKIGTNDSNKTYDVVAVWDAANKVWKLDSCTEVVA